MKTPMQELIDEMQKSPLMFASALALIEQMRMLKKEKEVMCQFAMDYVFSGEVGCAQWADGPAELDIDKSARDYYNETFNTKQK